MFGAFVSDLSGILKLAEALPHSQLTSLRWPTSPLNFAWTLCLCLLLRQQPLTPGTALVRTCSLDGNCLTGRDGEDMSGILKLAEALPHSQLTSLRWPASCLNFAWTLCPCLPLRQQPLTRGHPSSHSILSNSLGDSADTLVAAARELPQLVSLCGIKPEQEAVDFSNRWLDHQGRDFGKDAKLLAFDLSKNQTIKSLK